MSRLGIKDPMIISDENGFQIISGNCYYCDNPWKYRVDFEPIDAVTEKLTGKTVDIYVCQSCRDTKLTAFEDRIRSIRQKGDVNE